MRTPPSLREKGMHNVGGTPPCSGGRYGAVPCDHVRRRCCIGCRTAPLRRSPEDPVASGPDRKGTSGGPQSHSRPSYALVIRYC